MNRVRDRRRASGPRGPVRAHMDPQGERESHPGPDGAVGTSDFEYLLPPGRIARHPAARRADSRLMVLRRSTATIEHRRFRELPALVAPGDLMVVNDTRVFPARLRGRKPTGAAGEVLLLRPVPDGDGATWEALVRPGRKLKPGRVMDVAPELSVRIVDARPDGRRIVRLEGDLTVGKALERFGEVPLPPYLDREPEPRDRHRYQTVYARHAGSVAAPTAGLHFTHGLLAEIAARGVARCAITLHVGTATFRPVEVDDLADHVMDAEHYTVPESSAEAYGRCRLLGGRVWAVGTTVVRTLESVAAGRDRIAPGRGSTDLFISPPFRFRAVDCLVTNFHLPRSTLLMLVAAFAGTERVLEAYQEAVATGYRFYSYGDAMAILP